MLKTSTICVIMAIMLAGCAANYNLQHPSTTTPNVPSAPPNAASTQVGPSVSLGGGGGVGLGLGVGI